MLVDDAGLRDPPTPTWYRSRDDIRAFLLASLRRGAALAHDTVARRTAARVPGQRRTRRPVGTGAVEVLTLTAADGQVAEVVAFLDPALVARIAPSPPAR